MTLTTIVRTRTRKAALAATAMAVLGAAAITFAVATSSQAAPPPKTPVPAAIESPSPSASPEFDVPPASPTPPPATDKQPPEPQRQPTLPFGPVAADPVRVYTGDGDCLNLRPQPGTAFQADPKACVPEGFLLWLYGPAQEVGDETWRYALGEGWVATRYTKPEPKARSGFGPFKGVVVMNGDYVEVTAARVEANGAVTEIAREKNQIQGIGGTFGTLSPSGKYLAFTREERYVPTLNLIDLTTGVTKKFPGVNVTAWGPGDRLSVTSSPTCPQQCTWYPAWIDPAEGVVHRLSEKQGDWWRPAWSPDGGSMVVVTSDRKLQLVALDGNLTLLRELGENEYPSDMVVSPDGTRVFSGSYSGPLQILNLRSKAVVEMARAPQKERYGKCGGPGFAGTLAAWLDNQTIAWHESWGQKGYNGITIAGAGSGERRVIPFFSVVGMELAAPGLLSFTTIEYVDKANFPLTWLLDVKTGDAWPVSVGADPAWIE